MACSPSEATAAVSCSQDRCVKLWDLHRGYMSKQKVFPSTPYSLRYNLEGSMVASGHFDGTLRFWDFREQRLANEVAGLHTQQICSVSVGRRSGRGSAGLFVTIGFTFKDRGRYICTFKRCQIM